MWAIFFLQLQAVNFYSALTGLFHPESEGGSGLVSGQAVYEGEGYCRFSPLWVELVRG